MAASKTKSGDKKSKDGGGKAQGGLSERALFLILLGGAFAVAVLAYLTPPLRAVFLSEYGVFSNAAVLFYLVAFGYGVKGIYALNMESWKGRWKKLALLSLLALFMAGEELNWGLTFLRRPDDDWLVHSVKDLVALSLLGVPEHTEITLVGFIALVRWMMMLAAIYGVGLGLYHRKKIAAAWHKHRAAPAMFYACFFVVLIVLEIVMKAGFLPGHAVFGDCLRMGAALAFLLGGLHAAGALKAK